MAFSKENFNPFFRQTLFILVLLAMTLVLFDQLAFFIGSMLGAITLYMVFRPLQFRLVESHNWRGWLAALVITIICLLILCLFGWWTAKVIVTQVTDVDGNQIMSDIKVFMDKVNMFVGFKMIGTEAINRSEWMLTSFLSPIFNTTYSFVANTSMMLVILYFMLAGGRKMECKVLAYSPFKGKSLSMLKREVKNMIYSNAVGIPIILVGQTIASSLLYYLVGFESYFFWGFITAICGLVPLVGTALVYIPLGIYLASTGHLVSGLIVVAYGMIIVSNIDNLIRIFLLGKYAHTHPLIVIFGVIVGIPLFGFWGIIFGPLLISGLLLLVKIYFVEYGLIDPEHPDVVCVTGARKKTIKDMSYQKKSTETNIPPFKGGLSNGQ